ncbi:hypothetical protein GCM10023195_06690 [Actinoallomurus liliacearum]|uniref:Uncharacterized protein n=1 Tax=Actinoallomurus liliacearum TaxID=1080073 RepID=A0ABP8TA45_9ACTN
MASGGEAIGRIQTSRVLEGGHEVGRGDARRDDQQIDGSPGLSKGPLRSSHVIAEGDADPGANAQKILSTSKCTPTFRNDSISESKNVLDAPFAGLDGRAASRRQRHFLGRYAFTRTEPDTGVRPFHDGSEGR